jgi:hypothetical protein
MKDSDLKKVADTLEEGQAGLVVVYATNMNDQIDALVRAEDKYVTEEMKVDQATLDKQIAADASGS